MDVDAGSFGGDSLASSNEFLATAPETLANGADAQSVAEGDPFFLAVGDEDVHSSALFLSDGGGSDSGVALMSEEWDSDHEWECPFLLQGDDLEDETMLLEATFLDAPEEMHANVADRVAKRDSVETVYLNAALPHIALPDVDEVLIEDLVQSVFLEGSLQEADAKETLADAFPEFLGFSCSQCFVYLVAYCFLVRRQQPAHCLYQFLEYWGGAGAITRACWGKGLRAMLFDIAYAGIAAGENIHEAVGLRRWMLALMFTTVGALVWCGVPCTSWIWCCRAITQRSRDSITGLPMECTYLCVFVLECTYL